MRVRSAAPLIVLMMLYACGEGYELVPARLGIVNVPEGSFPAITTAVRDALTREGFEDLGKYEEMISLIQHDTAMPDKVKREQLVRLERELTYLDRIHHIRVVLSDFSNGVPPEMSLRYTRPSERFVEVDVYDERPGGFGSYGLRLYDRFLSALKQKYGDSVRVIDAPPATNEAEYKRITRQNTIAGIFGWSLAFALPMLLTGSLSRLMLRRLGVSVLLKRIIFVAINTWLVAPLPFPVAFIYVMPLPNLLAFPWISTDYYSRVAAYAAVSFPMALLICSALSMAVFRDQVQLEGAIERRAGRRR